MTPARIHRFEVVGELGRGAMGVVYRARDPELDREVAIKVVRAASPVAESAEPETTLDLRGPRTADASLDEARAMAKLSHPNVLPIFEVGRNGDEIFLVTEFVDGTTLRAHLATPRAVSEIVRVFALAAHGLAAAHACGIVHCDFKPDNVLIGRDGRVRVCDFGLANLNRATRRSLERIASPIGTPRYMPPEVLAGGLATAAADVFALCRAVVDALGERAPAVVHAGLADDPDARPSIASIIAALERPAGGRQRIWLAAGAVSAVIAATAVVVVLRRPVGPSCSGALAETLGGYTEDVRATLSPAAREGFDLRARSLDAADRGRCAASDTSEHRDLLRTACLARRANDLRVDLERERQPTTTPRANGVAAWSLRDPAECADVLAPPVVAPLAMYAKLGALDVLQATSAGPAEDLATAAEQLGDRELTGWALASAGVARRRGSEYAAAETLLARAFAIATEIYSANLSAFVLCERSRLAMFRGDPVASLEVARMAYTYVDRPELAALSRARIFYTIGVIEKVQSHIPVALDYLERGLAQFSPRKRGDGLEPAVVNPSLLVSILSAKADGLLVLDGRMADAEATARRAVEVARDALGPGHPNYNTAISQLADVFEERDDRASALPLREELVTLAERAAGSVPTNELIDVTNQLARLRAALGHVDEARMDLERLDAICERTPNLRWHRAEVLYALGTVTMQAGRLREGCAILARGIAVATAVHGADKLETLDLIDVWVGCELESGHPDEAATRVGDLVTGYRDHSRLEAAAFTAGAYGADLALSAGDPDRAEALARTALETHFTRPRLEAELLLWLARAQIGRRRFVDATTILARAAELLRGAPADELALVDVERARIAAGLGRRDDARSIAAAAREALAPFRGRVRARAAIDALR